jgi:acyl dehydratase
VKAANGSDIQPGDELPVLAIEMTATHIVAGALATRDFMPVHHDRDYAQLQGAPDIFMNILSTNAYCSRYVTDWAGPDAMLRRLSVRLGVPVFPNATLTFSGHVVGVTSDGEDVVVDLAFTASTALGDHATVTAVVSLPVRPRHGSSG